QVVYGVVGLKTHSKMLLITRREAGALVRYVHLSTGNYNARTARLYTDIGHLSADPELTSDIENVFLHLASHSRLPRLHQAWIAPFQLQRRFIDCIEQVGAAAGRGEDARIVLKMNALTDEALTLALVRAAQRGARIDLIVRGACILPPELPGLTDNIHVRSIIGRFLEHSRVFYFRANGQEKLYLSSADWMNRNMLRRIELAWPINDPALRQRIVDECLVASLYDHRDAWLLSADGSYQRVHADAAGHRHGMQDALMLRYGTPTHKEIEWT
ncbi:MAG: polyphosphate kinase 1, partial [Burkholderiaceae bacterium]